MPNRTAVPCQDLAFPISINSEVLAEKKSSRSPSRSSAGHRTNHDAYSAFHVCGTGFYSPSRSPPMGPAPVPVAKAPTSMSELQREVEATILQSQQVEAQYLHHYHPEDKVAIVPGARHWSEGQRHPQLAPNASFSEARELEQDLVGTDRVQQDIQRRDQEQIQVMRFGMVTGAAN